MALEKLTYTDGVTVIPASNLNDIQDAIIALENQQTSGVSDDLKTALLQLAQKVAYIDDNGQDYYTALYNALYPPVGLVSITAVFTQGSTVVYDTDSLDVLRPLLTVTANYDDSSSAVVTAYTLSGTLAAGTSTITASYGGKSDTFNVTVTSTAIIDQNVTMNSSTQTLLDQEVVYDSTALYSWQYTFGTHTPVSTATTPNRSYGPLMSNGAVRDGALQYNGSASEWRYTWKSSGIAFTPADGDVLTYVHNFATNGTSLYLNGTQLRSESIGQSYYNPVGKIVIQPDNAQMTVGITHIKIAKGDLH